MRPQGKEHKGKWGKKDSILNVLTEEQISFLEKNSRKISESELFHKLSEIGPDMDPSVFEANLHELASKVKSYVLKQELSEEELMQTSGGLCGLNGYCDKDATHDCTKLHHRDIYGGGGFPNCAATVEYDSWCWSNDACYSDEVVYDNRKSEECSKAWE